jgi:nucleoside-diphosphate-sugar epimerase
MTPGRVVVTGAAGFIGRHLIDRLVAGGHEVLGIVRSNPLPLAPGVRFVARDLTATPSVSDLLQPGDTLVHLAARAHVMHDRSADPLVAYRAANVAPVQMLCESVIASGATRLIFLSSAKIYGEGRPTPYTLQDAAGPVDDYGRSKWEAEELLRRAATGGSFEWTILRPPFVYGPGGKGNFPRLVQLANIAARVPLPLGAVRNARSVIFVGNLVDAIQRCVVHPGARDRVFLPTDERDVSTPELLEAIARARGRHARLFRCPTALVRGAAALAGRRAEIDRLTESLQLDGSALRRELRWEPPYSLEESIRLSLAPPPAPIGRAASVNH